MSDPIEKIKAFMLNISPDDQWKIIGMGLIPVINNIFLEIKKEQFLNTNREGLQRIVSLVSTARLGHFFIYGAVLAKIMECLSLKWRLTTLASIAAYYVGLEMHIEHITLQVRKNP